MKNRANQQGWDTKDPSPGKCRVIHTLLLRCIWDLLRWKQTYLDIILVILVYQIPCSSNVHLCCPTAYPEILHDHARRTNGKLQLRFPALFLPSKGIMTLCRRGLVVMQVPAAWVCKLVRLLWQKHTKTSIQLPGRRRWFSSFRVCMLAFSFSRCAVVFRGNRAREAEARFYN